jgi:dihydrofolate reductase
MTEIIYHVAATADNFIADPNGVADDSIFLYDADDGGDFFTSVKQYDLVLMGSKTYAYGFQFGLKPGEPSGIAQAANPDLKHYVFSRSMNFESNEKVELVKDNAVQFVKKLKQKDDQKMWLMGGGQLAGTLLDNEMIDKLMLKIHPVMIGHGIPLFGPSQKRIDLKLSDFKRYSSGVLLVTYNIVYP